MAAQFLNDAVLTGLQRLLALRLVGSPPADAIELTASVWIDAIVRYPIAWNEQLDAWRLQAGFDQLVWRSERWPTVKHLIDSLPKRLPPPPLPKPVMTKRMQQEGKQRLKKILDELDVKRMPPEHDGRAALNQAIQTLKQKD